MKFDAAIKVLALITIITNCCFGIRVYEGPPLPYGVSGHCAGIVGGKVVVVGGSYWSEDKTQKVFLKKSLVFKNGCWGNGPQLPLELYCSMFDYDDSGLYIAGGRNYEKLTTDVLHLSDVNGRIVVARLPGFPEGIADGAAVVYRSTMYVSCGAIAKGLTNAMWAMDMKSEHKQWVHCQPLPGPARAFPAMAKCGDRIILMGGILLPEYKVLKDAYAYYPKEDRWEKLANMPSPCYGFGARALDDTQILIAGIGDEKIRNSIWTLNVRNMSVRNVGDTIIQSVGNALVQVSPKTFWLIGGEPDANKSRTDKVTTIELK